MKRKTYIGGIGLSQNDGKTIESVGKRGNCAFGVMAEVMSIKRLNNVEKKVVFAGCGE